MWTRDAIVRLPPDEYRAISALIDEAGARSARAQGLPAPITSTVRPSAPPKKTGTRRQQSDDEHPRSPPPPLIHPHAPQDRLLEDQRLYLACSDATRPRGGPSVLVGILKVGPKRLFVAKPSGGMEEMEPCCVLDFYVHESSQRGGWGSLLFDAFLQREDRHPARLAYDRPSPKLVAFMAKHHNLRAFAKQNNNFVVFDEYWSEEVRNFGVARARNGGRPETARVGGREGLGAAARKRAEAARRAAAELEQRRKPPETSGNFLKPARPTGSFGFQRQQQ